MTIDEAIEYFAGGDYVYDVDSDGYGGYTVNQDLKDAVKIAIEALEARQEAEKNEPLTLSEMSKMEGQPVWRKNLEFPDRPAQCKVIFHYGRHTEHISWTDDKHNLFRDYGKTWLAYRHPPKEKENE